VTPGQGSAQDGSLQDGAATLAGRLVTAIAAPYDIDGHPVVIGCSIGVAVVPEHGTRVDANREPQSYMDLNSSPPGSDI